MNRAGPWPSTVGNKLLHGHEQEARERSPGFQAGTKSRSLAWFGSQIKSPFFYVANTNANFECGGDGRGRGE
jgi:hypothetical protein